MGQVAATRRTPEDPGERAAAHLRERQKAVSVGPLFPGRGWRSEGAQGRWGGASPVLEVPPVSSPGRSSRSFQSPLPLNNLPGVRCVSPGMLSYDVSATSLWKLSLQDLLGSRIVTMHLKTFW